MMKCPTCQKTMEISQLHCTGCDISLQGHFSLPRLARLPREHMRLAEEFLLCGGNLKDLAARLGISYPTLRRRVDGMIAALEAVVAEDRQAADEILAGIEQGRITPEDGLRRVRDLNGEQE